MASRPMKLKLIPRSVMKAKSLTRLPAEILGGSGILVARSAGTWTVSVDAANLPAIAGLVIGVDVQAYDADLQALAGNSTNGLLARTGAGTVSSRTLTAPAAGITVTNGDGVSGNPTLVLANDLAALEGLSSTGFPARTATDTYAQRTLAAPAAGLTITNPAGIAGDPTFALANDLAALEALASTGIAARTTTDTWAQRTITGTAAEITVTFGDGVSGNPTLSIPAAVTFTGKTVTGGTFNAPTIQGGTINSLAGLSIANNGFNFSFASSDTLTANRTLTFKVNDAARTVDLSGNLTLASAVSLPAIVQGDLWYGSASGVISALAKDTVGAKFVKNSGTSSNPAWSALALSDLPTQAAYTFLGNNTGSAAVPTAVDIATLTAKASPASTDLILLSDQAASGAWKKATLSSVASAGSVSSIAGNTGAFTLSGLLTNSTNDLRVLAAAQSDQETSTSTTLAVTPGRQQFHPSAAKAWVAFTGSTGVILASYNVTSVTRNSTGNYNVNFTNSFSTANYAASVSAATSGAGFCLGFSDSSVNSAGLCRLAYQNSVGSAADPAVGWAIFYGDQ